MEFQIPKIVHEEVVENRGVFVIEPLDRGFGYTFGNSLRRVLLSSLEGAAVTSVKIEGVSHEFTTIPGVREDVTDIILNLKSMICVLHGESPEIEVRMSARGAGDVTAGDIEAPADLEILNPELVLGVRSYNCLKRAGIQTVGDLISKSEAELNAIPNFGKKSIDEVIETLHARGLSLRQD